MMFNAIPTLIVAGVVAGCGGSAPVPEPPAEQTALQEVGQMYQAYEAEFRKPPSKGQDVMRYAPGFSHGSMAVQNKDVEVAWGVPLSAGSKSVLAYEKGTPKGGGKVLLADGETLAVMTPAEFEAAPKAGK